jgi:hypothetical protein
MLLLSFMFASKAHWHDFLLCSEKPFIVRGKELLIILGVPPNEEQRAKEDVCNPAVISKETKRCVDDLVRFVTRTAYALFESPYPAHAPL